MQCQLHQCLREHWCRAVRTLKTFRAAKDPAHAWTNGVDRTEIVLSVDEAAGELVAVLVGESDPLLWIHPIDHGIDLLEQRLSDDYRAATLSFACAAGQTHGWSKVRLPLM